MSMPFFFVVFIMLTRIKIYYVKKGTNIFLNIHTYTKSKHILVVCNMIINTNLSYLNIKVGTLFRCDSRVRCMRLRCGGGGNGGGVDNMTGWSLVGEDVR